MGKKNRLAGLLAGVMTGAALWMGMPGEAAVQEIPTEFTKSAEQAEDSAAAISSNDNTSAIPAEAAAPASLKLHALSAVLMDGDSGRILYEKDGGAFRPMASTTKIMTCILALENGGLSDICTVSEKAASQPKVRLGAGKGSRFYLKDLLYSLMLESHNDTAVVIAEHIGGSVEGFAAMMNQKARDLGCGDTWFITPNGLDARENAPDGSERTHGTTAADLAAIMRYCICQSPKREEFLAITRTSDHSFTEIGGTRSYSCVNHNALLSMMEGALSGKTGFTGGAGYSYVGALEDEGRTFVLALLGSGWPPHKTYKWEDARALFEYGKSHYQYRQIPPGPELKEIPVEDGVPVRAGEERVQPVGENMALRLTLGEVPEESLRFLMAEEEQAERRLRLPEKLKAPVKAGDIVGYVSYLLAGKELRVLPVYAAESAARRDISWCGGQVFWRSLLWD